MIRGMILTKDQIKKKLLNLLVFLANQQNQFSDCKGFKKKMTDCSYVLRDVVVRLMNLHSRNTPKFARRYFKKRLKRNNKYRR